MAISFNLPLLAGNVTIVDGQGRPTSTFISWWQTNRNAIVAAINAIESIPEIQAALLEVDAAAAAANAAAIAANTAAGNAQASADATTEATSLANSYVTGLTLSTTDTGTSITVNISAHTRVYGNGTSVSVNAGTVTGLPYSPSTTNLTTEIIYYSDPTRAGGTETYQATTNASTAAQVGDVHTVGSIVMPVAAAGTPNTGHPVRPPGVGSIAF